MRFTSKQIVTMVVSVCAAAVLAPVGVHAATGQLVNLVDPVLSARKVRVGSVGALQVESRPGVPGGATNVSHVDIATLTPQALLEVNGPTRIALSELTVTVRKFGSPVVAATIVDLIAYAHVTGTNPCGQSGWTGTHLRRVQLNTGESQQWDFDGPPLVVPRAANGQRQCLAAKLYQWVGDTRVDVGATVFHYE